MNTATTTHELKTAQPDAPIHDLIAKRFSPYAWADRDVDPATLKSLFEAARWAPSAYNEQPARYVVATRDDPEAFQRLLEILVEPNRAWAQHAPVLAIGVVATRFARNGKDNATAKHDLGLASANLCVEATAHGLSVHQMSGIQPDVARELLGLPDGFEAVTGLAIGHADATTELEADRTPRSRRSLTESVFAGRWEAPAGFVR